MNYQHLVVCLMTSGIIIQLTSILSMTQLESTEAEEIVTLSLRTFLLILYKVCLNKSLTIGEILGQTKNKGHCFAEAIKPAT